MIDDDLLNILICPDCKSDVEELDGMIICKNCHKKYPIRNGVPIMLVQEAQD